MKAVRTIKGVNLRDQIEGKVIRGDLEDQEIVRCTKARRRFWMNLVDRMADDGWAKWPKDEKSNSRKSPSRFPRRWCRSCICASQ
ncbi:hypothetical protein Trydic_g3974 [Trypoxylus dichotomus]